MPFWRNMYIIQWRPTLQVHFVNQEEDSEEEPKLKYERLSNGVTEILQKDAASCMTVHDKVEPESSTGFTLFMYTFERWHPILFAPSPAFPLREVLRSHCLLFLFPLFHIFRSSPLFVQCWYFFNRPLSAWRLIVVAAHTHAWAEQKSYPVMSPHLMFY